MGVLGLDSNDGNADAEVEEEEAGGGLALDLEDRGPGTRDARLGARPPSRARGRAPQAVRPDSKRGRGRSLRASAPGPRPGADAPAEGPSLRLGLPLGAVLLGAVFGAFQVVWTLCEAAPSVPRAMSSWSELVGDGSGAGLARSKACDLQSPDGRPLP